MFPAGVLATVSAANSSQARSSVALGEAQSSKKHDAVSLLADEPPRHCPACVFTNVGCGKGEIAESDVCERSDVVTVCVR